MSGRRDARAAALQARTRAAVEELREISCSDPAAAQALDTIRLAVHTLQQWWLPELARLVTATPIVS